jgi:hypothetical protein
VGSLAIMARSAWKGRAGGLWALSALLCVLWRGATPVNASGALSSVSASSNSLRVGATGVQLDVTFTITDALPVTGQILIGFPAVYSLTQGSWGTSAVTALTGNLDGSFSTSASSTNVTITRSGGSQVRLIHEST